MELYEDTYEKKPNLHIAGDDELELEEPLEETGDALIDEIERRTARGENVDDLLEMLEPKPKEPALKTDGSFFKKE